MRVSLPGVIGLVTMMSTSTLWGCSDSSSSSPEVSEGGVVPPGDPTTNAPDASPNSTGTCNAVTQVGSQVDAISTKEPAPAPAGGPIVDGTFTLTGAKIHNPQLPEGTKVSALGATTLVLRGGKVEVVATDDKGVVTHRNETYSPSGTSVSVVVTCQDARPGGGGGRMPPVPTGYTSTPTTFTHFLKQPDGTIVEVLLTKVSTAAPNFAGTWACVGHGDAKFTKPAGMPDLVTTQSVTLTMTVDGPDVTVLRRFNMDGSTCTQHWTQNGNTLTIAPGQFCLQSQGAIRVDFTSGSGTVNGDALTIGHDGPFQGTVQSDGGSETVEGTESLTSTCTRQ